MIPFWPVPWLLSFYRLLVYLSWCQLKACADLQGRSPHAQPAKHNLLDHSSSHPEWHRAIWKSKKPRYINTCLLCSSWLCQGSGYIYFCRALCPAFKAKWSIFHWRHNPKAISLRKGQALQSTFMSLFLMGFFLEKEKKFYFSGHFLNPKMPPINGNAYGSSTNVIVIL